MTPGPRPEIDRLVHAELGRSLIVARKTFLTAISNRDFIPFCMARYARGQRDYGFAYAWLDWPEQQFRGEILTEVADIALYEAMAAVVRERGGG